MYCFIQHDDTRQVDITTDFYEFQNRYNLNYGDRISVVNQLQEKIHESITVADYLKELPET
jgi:hypothetical protein